MKDRTILRAYKKRVKGIRECHKKMKVARTENAFILRDSFLGLYWFTHAGKFPEVPGWIIFFNKQDCIQHNDLNV